ncbi:alpha/beta hydrolase [Tsukamurella sp. 8F]|uniref:alpha/beta fold hydrolase n=1 Tax=unclassified Tsukamurella TaxID=2633480 RepID=UPI0023B99D19|nr:MULTISPECIES: alpha/beta hydrolase [unclassified Tsukamurella]MDF0532136.1 alpha/beta hydrolase [Tsukamurella sp. 8J]MDF0585177.1 alpha/beta hydrolase [Tsukamurella sp. 8F]
MPSSLTSLRFAHVHGYRRAFRIGGSGPALLLLHGVSDNSLVWEPLLDPLARRYTVIAPDLLGHGLSDRPRADYSISAFANGMRDLLTYLGIDRVTVVGHSLGGGVAGQFAYQFPETVERLVYVSTGGVSRDVSPVLRALTLPFAETLLTSLAVPGVLPAARLALAGLAQVPLPAFRDSAELVRVLERMPERGSPAAFGRTLRSVVDSRGQVVTMLDRIYLTADIPTLIVWGTADSVIPVAHAEMLHGATAGSELELFDGAGHFPFREQPERFLALLTDFVDRTVPARVTTADLREMLRRGITEADITGDDGTRLAVLEELGSAERSAT